MISNIKMQKLNKALVSFCNNVFFILLLLHTGANVRMVNMKALTTGVLHTKFWVVDKKHIYIGSANMDWRSLTQV